MKRVFLVTTYDDEDVDSILSLPSKDVTELAPDDLIASFPKELQKYVVFEIERDEIISLDFGAVVDLLDYLIDRPKTVCQTIIKLHAAVTNLFHHVYDDYNLAKEALEEHTAARTAYFASSENDLPFKRTKDNIEKMIRSEQAWKNLNRSVVKLESNKSRLYSTRSMLDRVHKMCDDFAKNSINIDYDGGVQDRGFNSVASSVIGTTAKVNVVVDE